MTKIVFEKVLQAPWCTFDRRGASLKLFGQCPYGNSTFQKGAFPNEDDEDDDNEEDDEDLCLAHNQLHRHYLPW